MHVCSVTCENRVAYRGEKKKEDECNNSTAKCRMISRGCMAEQQRQREQ